MIRRPPRSTLFSLHDALPIFSGSKESQGCLPESPRPERSQRAVFSGRRPLGEVLRDDDAGRRDELARDRKSTRLNSSHSQISYAVFCLKKKKKMNQRPYSKTI